MSVLLFIVILLVLIVVHEFGHFVAAKRMGMRVDEFGIGFPPRIIGWKPRKSETTYSVNWLPLGGFVKIFGEDGEESRNNTKGKAPFNQHSRWAQAIVLSAGVFFNIVLAWVLVSAGYIMGIPASTHNLPASAHISNDRAIITYVVPDSPAEQAGLEPLDTVIALTTNNAALQAEAITPGALQTFVREQEDEEIALLYARNGERNTVFVQTQEGIVDGERVIGISVDRVGTVRMPISAALVEGVKTTASLTAMTTVLFWDLITDAFSGQGDFSQIRGPVGIVGLVDSALAQGYMQVLILTVLISISLAIINLIPFPALDGGRLLFLGIEAVTRKPISPRISGAANTIGFFILIGLMVAVTYQDITRIIGG